MFPDRLATNTTQIKAKAVFVGLSERLRPEQKDGFYTVFSQPTGIDMSGVEIAATAFANLLEDMPVRPLSPGAHIAVIMIWGVLVGILCRLFPTVIAAVSMIGLGWSFSFFSSDTCRFSKAGYIMKNKQMPMGIEMPLTCQESIVSPIPAIVWDKMMPTTMQSATHIARYFSNALTV